MLDATTKPVPAPPNRTPVLVASWLALGGALALAGVLGRAPLVGPAFVVASVVGWAIAYARRGAVRAWADALPMRGLVALHAARLPIGAGFLAAAARGELAPTFAARAGWGDIAIGAAAVVVAGVGWRRRGVLRALAVAGLVDILVAVGTGMYLVLVAGDPGMRAAFARLPYPFLPLAVVPLVVVSHLLVLARTAAAGVTPARERAAAPPDRR